VSDEPGRGFWIGLALGTPVMAYGAIALVDRAGWPRALAAGRWLAGGLLLHDLVLVPVVLGVVWLVGRVTPDWLRTPARAGLLGSALVVALGWPGLRGYGKRPDNATIHPLHYSSAVLTVLGALWCATAVWAAWRFTRRRRLPALAPGSPASAPGSPRTSRTPAPG
jgi:hypothetical protein